MSDIVRAGETEIMDFELEQGGLPFDLTNVDTITLWRLSSDNVWSSTVLEPTGLLQVYGDATNGIVRLTPNTAWWEDDIAFYDMYIYVEMLDGTKHSFHRYENIRVTVKPKHK